MKNRILEAFRIIFRLAVRLRLYPVLKPWYLFMIKQYDSNGSYRSIDKNSFEGKLNILSLSPDVFRGDLEVLGKQEDLNVFRIHHGWQRLISYAFYPEGMDVMKYYNADQYENIKVAQDRCRAFLRVLLPYLYSKVPVDCIVIPNVRYLEDLDWCYVSKELGKKVVLMFREGLMMFDRGYSGTMERHKRFGKYQGDHIIVHNNISKKMFVESGFARPEIVSINGVLRMDDFIRKIKNNTKAPQRKIVTLFYFNYDKNSAGKQTATGYSPPGVPFEIYRDTILTLIMFARNNPDVDVVIKPKPKDIESGQFTNLIHEEGIRIDDLKNLKILPEANVHDLIISSSVIIGLQTTAILESAIAGKAIIFPYFKKFRESEWSQRFGYKNYLDIFDNADDTEDLQQKISNYLNGYKLSNEVQNKRNQLFEEYLSSLQGNATKLYVNTIKQVVGK